MHFTQQFMRLMKTYNKLKTQSSWVHLKIIDLKQLLAVLLKKELTAMHIVVALTMKTVQVTHQ